MLNAIGYVRRSTDRQDESLDQQRQKLEAFAHLRGWKLVHVYCDDAISGSDLDRPGLGELLRRVEQDGEVGAVIAWDRNRLARAKDPIDGINLERRITSARKRLVYAATGQEAERSLAGGLVSFVEHYQSGDFLRKLSRDVTRGLLAKVQRGLWPGGVAPFGYDRVYLDPAGEARKVLRQADDGALLVMDAAGGEVLERVPAGRRYRKQDHEECTLAPSLPQRVRAVQGVFADYANGVPVHAIRDRLNAAGFRTATGGLFSVPALQVILDNPVYTGRCVYNRRTQSKWHRLVEGASVERQDEGREKRPESDWVVVEDAWEALIDADLFERVKARRAVNRGAYRATGSSVHAGYLLGGRMVCGVCGGKMVGQTTSAGKRQRRRYRQYTCGRHHHGDHAACPKRYTVPADAVELHLLGIIEADLRMLRDDERLHAYIAEEYARLTAGRGDARTQLERRLAGLRERAGKLRDHLLALDVESAKLLGLPEQARALAQESAAIEAELARCGPALPPPPSAGEVRQRAAALFDRLGEVLAGGTLEERRELIGRYVQKVETDPARQVVRFTLYPPLFATTFTSESPEVSACPWHPPFEPCRSTSGSSHLA